MLTAIPNDLRNLEYLHTCAMYEKANELTVADALDTLKERGLVTDEMLKNHFTFEKLLDAEVKRVVDEAVRYEYPYSENNELEIYADYRDNLDFLLENLYENRESSDLRDMVNDMIYEAYEDMMLNEKDKILGSIEVSDSELDNLLEEYFDDVYSFKLPYDHYLDQTMKVNIMLATPEELNCDCGLIHDQYIALDFPKEVCDPIDILNSDSGLTYLLKQQGHTMDELAETMKNYNKFFYEDGCVKDITDEKGNKLSLDESIKLFNKDHNAFLTSVCQELENHSYSMGVITCLAKMSVRDFIEMQEGNKEIVFPKDATVGIFNPWNGSGSVLEIELEKHLSFTTDMIRDIQIEGIKPDYEYTIDSVYGLISSCWKGVTVKDLPPVIDKAEVKKPSLEEQIKSAEAMKTNPEPENTAMAMGIEH